MQQCEPAESAESSTWTLALGKVCVCRDWGWPLEIRVGPCASGSRLLPLVTGRRSSIHFAVTDYQHQVGTSLSANNAEVPLQELLVRRILGKLADHARQHGNALVPSHLRSALRELDPQGTGTRPSHRCEQPPTASTYHILSAQGTNQLPPTTDRSWHRVCSSSLTPGADLSSVNTLGSEGTLTSRRTATALRRTRA